MPILIAGTILQPLQHCVAAAFGAHCSTALALSARFTSLSITVALRSDRDVGSGTFKVHSTSHGFLALE